MSDRQVMALAAAVWFGAWWAAPVPRWAGFALVLLAIAFRWWRFGLLAAVVLAAGQAHGHAADLATPQRGAVDATVELVADPRPVGRSVWAEAQLGDERVQLRAVDAAAMALRPRLSGERVSISAWSTPVPADDTYLSRRGVTSIVRVRSVRWWQPGSPVSRLANGLRRLITDGAASLDPDQQTLFTGFVIGDDREQRALVTDDFRASGLGHLLAVSGANVAFLLALLAPALDRMSFRWRVIAVLLALGFFALVTRFEPSVIRATAMAALAAIAAGLGRPSEGRRLLALAVAVVLLLQPGLVHQVGFQLSVAASAGILLAATRLSAAIPGPRVLATAIAVTTAAQLAVAPLLLATFGPVPVASLPANVLVAPVAGPVSAWGLTGGVVAGVVGGWVGEVLHWPTGILLGWVQFVAGRAAVARFGLMGVGHLVAAAGAVGLALWAHERSGAWFRRCRRGALAVLVVALVAPAIAVARPVEGRTVAGGVTVWRSDATVVVVEQGDSAVRALAGVREAGVRAIDLLVVADRQGASAALAAALAERYEVGLILAPVGHRVVGGTAVERDRQVRVGSWAISVTAVGGRLEVEVRALSRTG